MRTSPPPKFKVGGLKIGASYGSNMIKVLSALEAYWENRNNTQMFKEQLLYNLWKVCNKWLELKSYKTQQDGASELFLRRKAEIELLRDQALEELHEVSPKVAEALRDYQSRKQQLGQLGYQLKGLSNGYDLERQHYLQTNKKSGSSISGTQVHGQTVDILRDKSLQKGKALKIAKKGFGNLSLEETQILQRLFPQSMPPVVYMNKIMRLKYMVSVTDGKICDSNGDPILMSQKGRHFKYDLVPYAMDKYGNLYMATQWFGNKEYVEQDGEGNFQVKSTTQFNHSSFLAGSDVLCAGCLHIGWDNRRQAPAPGLLSAIDSSSGHYKPTTEYLRNCLEVLQGFGVNVDLTRVGDCSVRPRVFYWGRDFMANRYPWIDPETPPNSFFQAPPINLDA